ncbi:MAG: leucine-rich repeat protein [Bacteroidaceae bacterium]|nr:leucine-rich repeat protein [Bacteroidaceae bacterium]
MNHFLLKFRLTATLLLCLGLCQSLFADPITREQAKARAEAFMQGVSGSKKLISVSNLARLAPRHKAATDELELYYVFNRGTDEGFVIVSGDDMTLPVLGYTDSGDFDYQSLPDNMRFWLDNYESQLATIRENSGQMKAAPRYAPVHSAIEPMITSKWSQGDPYNRECPMYFNKGRSVTGCVATAMAQLLYYWRNISVTETQADMPSYTLSNETLGEMVVEGIPAGSPIDWNNMIDNYGSGFTGIQATAVAQLMHYCGVSVSMGYTNSSSGAYSSSVDDAFINYFGYNNSVRYVYGDNYSADGWDALLYNELAEGRPFYLSGSNNSGGHAFVCDGYDGNHCFHINWGWGGTSDGYFLLTSLNPSSQGIGGSGDGYSGYPEAIIGIQPPANGSRAMTFANPTVKKICYENFDANNDDIVTYSEIADVKDLGTVFKGQNIAKFDELRYFTGITSLPDSAFAGCTRLTSISLPKQLTTISHAAFAGCKLLKTFTFSSGITDIGSDAFNGCVKLADISLPSNLRSIEASAFKGCTALTSIALPVPLTTIGDEAFANCTKLTSVIIEGLLPQQMTLGKDIFANVNLTSATLAFQQGSEDFIATTEPWNQFGSISGIRNLAQGQFAELEENKPYYIYNLGTGRYLTKGEAWGSQAVVAMTDQPMRFEIRRTASMPEGVYYLYSDDTDAAGHYLFRTTTDPKVGNGVKACFVDGTIANNGANTRWKIVKNSNYKTYTIQTPSGTTGYVKTEFLGISPSHASNEASPTYGAYSDVSYDQLPLNCQWMLVPYDTARMANYAAAAQLANLLDVGQQKHLNVDYEQSVYNDMSADTETLLRTVRTLRKRMNLINFSSDALRRICVNKFDTNGDGELSYSEATIVEYLYNDCGFQNNTEITTFDEIKYFTGLHDIYYSTFNGCSNLQRITLPSTVQGIGWYAFRNCTSLKSIELGSSTNDIAEDAFVGCTALREVRLPVEDPTTINVDEKAFEQLDLSLITLYVPQGSRDLYAQAPVWKEFGKIVEMHVVSAASSSELAVDEPVYIMNVANRRYINKGEAYGTQAVVDYSGIIYKVRRTTSMKEGLYYLEAVNSGTSKKVLFRTNSDSKVGSGVKACFVDGDLSTKAYWSIQLVDSATHTYTIQVPSSDKEYVDSLYLGYNYYHDSNASSWGTYGIYYDVTYADDPAACQWQFIRLSDIEEVERQRLNLQSLRQLIVRAKNKNIDVVAEETVYDNLSATDDDIMVAIASLRNKLHYIDFVDEKAKTICINYWDEDEDGELTTEEAASVTDIRNAFASNTGLVTLEDLRYFTGLTSIPANAFKNTSSLQAVWLPANVTSVERLALTPTSVLKYIVIMNPDNVVSAETSTTNTQTVFVPAALLDAYTTNEKWNPSRISTFTGVPMVTPDSASRYYGRTNPTLTYHVDGAPIIGQPALNADSVLATTPVGNYEIVCEQGSVKTEGVIYNPGVITIEPSPLTITANSYTRNIGEDNPEFELTYRSFRNREKSDVLLVQPTVECDATKDSPAGEYEIRVFGAEAQNYTFTYENGILTVVDPDGITDVTTNATSNTTIHDLSGREISNSYNRTRQLPRGVYIINGKKVIVK